MALASIADIVDDIRHGKMVILMDDEDRENEGDLIIAAEAVTPEAINFYSSEACGLICLTITQEQAQRLDLPLMVRDNRSQHETNFTVSIDAADRVGPGISAEQRAKTVLAAVNRGARPQDISQPGHIFPLVAKAGGVLRRAGHTEAGTDLARMAGFAPASLIVEIMNEDGTMARRPELEAFAEKHDLKIGTIADLIHYRIHNENTVSHLKSKPLKTEFGEFIVHTFKDSVHNSIHVALTKGEIRENEPVITRVHVPDVMRDLFMGQEVEQLGWPMYHVMEKIAEEGTGVVVMLNIDDHSNPHSHIQWFMDEEAPPRSAAQDARGAYLSIGTGAQILRHLGVGKMRLLSSKARFNAISGFDLEIVEYLPFGENDE